MVRSILIGVLAAVLVLIGFAAWESATAQPPGVRMVRVPGLQVVDARGKVFLCIRIRPSAPGIPQAAEIVFYDAAGQEVATVDARGLSAAATVRPPTPAEARLIPPYPPGHSPDDRSAKALERIADEMKGQRFDDAVREMKKR